MQVPANAQVLVFWDGCIARLLYHIYAIIYIHMSVLYDWTPEERIRCVYLDVRRAMQLLVIGKQ